MTKAWRDGDCVVVSRFGGELPPKCVRYGDQPIKKEKKTLRWNPKSAFAWYFLLQVVTVPETAEVFVYWGRRAVRRRTRNTLLGMGVMLLGFGIFAGFLDTALMPLSLAGIVLVLVGLAVATSADQIRVKRMSPGFVWISELPAALRAELPSWKLAGLDENKIAPKKEEGGSAGEEW